MGGSFGFGAAIFFLLPIAAVLLLVVVVTIPLGLFLLLALALLYTLGYVAGAHVLGRQLVKPPSSRFLAFLIGWMILRGIGLIPSSAASSGCWRRSPVSARSCSPPGVPGRRASRQRRWPRSPRHPPPSSRSARGTGRSVAPRRAAGRAPA
jgi:hypothetical protein